MAARTLRTRVLERGPGGSTVTLSVLPGGLRVVTESVPGARSASVGIWVGVGSVDEAPRLAGASHYLEHLLFKGTRERTGAEIASAIDAVGGELNAFTSHEYTCFYAHVLADNADLAVGLVCEVVLDAVVGSADVDTERSVILDEIAMRDDDPEDTLADLFAAEVFAGHPVSSPVIGSADCIEAMSRAQIAGYYRRRYSPDKMVLSVAGGIDHGDVVRWARRAFAGRLVDGAAPRSPRTGRGLPDRAGGMRTIARDIEQAHLCVGVPALRRADPRRYALGVLSTALGGGMSSRLFRTIREEHGLAYSCYSATSAYADVGSFSVYAGCHPENLGRVAGLIAAELARAAAEGLTDAELDRAKGQLAGSLILGLEDTESRMSRMGKRLLVRTGYMSVVGELAAIAAVTTRQVSVLAREMLDHPMSLGLVGPYAHRKDVPPEVAALTGGVGGNRHAAAPQRRPARARR